MKHIARKLALLLVSFSITSAAEEQPERTPERTPERVERPVAAPDLDELFKRLDKNEDGVLCREEFAAYIRASRGRIQQPARERAQQPMRERRR